MKTTLSFLQKLSRTPREVSRADVVPMRAAGVSDAAIEEAIVVCLCFSIISRLADAFDFAMSTKRQQQQANSALRRIGYVLCSMPDWGCRGAAAYTAANTATNPAGKHRPTAAKPNLTRLESLES